MTLQEKASLALSELTLRCQQLEKSLACLPDGRLRTQRNGRSIKWYQSLRGRRHYIPKSNRLLAEELAYKSYLEKELIHGRKELAAIESFLANLPSASDRSTELNSMSFGFQDLISSYLRRQNTSGTAFPGKLTPLNEELEAWTTAPYEANPVHPENKIVPAGLHLLVRSKSEAFIVNVLNSRGIPFRYEAAFRTQNSVLYPDFTIRHPMSGAYYLWEHFGLIENEAYQHNAFAKISLYIKAGFIPGNNLIMTFESADHPLSLDQVAATADLYFV